MVASGVIAPLGVEIAFLVGSVAAAIVAAIVAMELRRGPVMWAFVGFFATFVVVSGVHAAL